MTQRRFRFGISTTVDYSVPLDRQIPAIKRAGFDFVSIGADITHSCFMEIEKFRRHLDLACNCGLEVTSIHLPFKDGYDLTALDTIQCQIAITNIIRGLELTASYNIPLAIVHPHYYFEEPVEKAWPKGWESLQQVINNLPPGLRLAMENLPDHRGSWFCRRVMETFNASQIGLCYDSSHENMSGNPLHILREFHDRITVTHLSDNHGQSDEHLIPGDGNIDWARMRQLLEKSPNLTDLLFEVGTGDPLEMPLDRFLEKTMICARKYFG